MQAASAFKVSRADGMLCVDSTGLAVPDVFMSEVEIRQAIAERREIGRKHPLLATSPACQG